MMEKIGWENMMRNIMEKYNGKYDEKIGWEIG